MFALKYSLRCLRYTLRYKMFLVQVKNLRSSVARAAIACFGDLFSTLGSCMEKVPVSMHGGWYIHTEYVHTLQYWVDYQSGEYLLIARV